jgi:hypothetical protein
VIATTDKSLNKPLVPKSFVKRFVSHDGTIGVVDLEHEVVKHGVSPIDDYFGKGSNKVIRLVFNGLEVVVDDKKKYTIEDMERAFNAGVNSGLFKSGITFKDWLL